MAKYTYGGSSFREATEAGHEAVPARVTLGAAIRQMGGNAATAQAMGLERGTKEYKSMMRQLQMYQTGQRAPSEATARKMRDAMNAQGIEVTADDLRRRAGEKPTNDKTPIVSIVIEANAAITISKDSRGPRWVKSTLQGGAAERAFTDLEAGWRETFRAYMDPRSVELNEVLEVRVTVER